MRNRGFTLCCQPNEKGQEFQGTLIRQGTDAEGCQGQKRTVRDNQESTRSWSGAPLLSIVATINQRTYETKRPIKESYESEKSKRIIFDDELPKWNYLIRYS